MVVSTPWLEDRQFVALLRRVLFGSVDIIYGLELVASGLAAQYGAG